MRKEKLKIVKIISLNKLVSITSSVLKTLPDECMIVPYNFICYVITLDSSKLTLPETILISYPTQKPSIFLVQPLDDSVEITLEEFKDENLPLFLMKDGFSDYIKKKYNAKNDRMIQIIGKKIIKSLIKFINFDLQ